MRRMYISFGVKYQNILVGRDLKNYYDIFVVTPMYIKYVAISVHLFKYILAVEYFILNNLVHFLYVSLGT